MTLEELYKNCIGVKTDDETPSWTKYLTLEECETLKREKQKLKKTIEIYKICLGLLSICLICQKFGVVMDLKKVEPRVWVLIGAIAFLISTFAFFSVACTEGERQSFMTSRKADNFETTRILTVINTRTDKIVFRLTGTFSCQYSNGDLDIICAVDENEYEKHFFHLNDNLTFIVEDTTNTTGDPYDIVVEYYPEIENE